MFFTNPWKPSIEVYGKLVEMGETVETPVMLKQNNHAVIKMSEMITAHEGSKHLRISQAFIHEEVREGLVSARRRLRMRMEQIPTRSHRLVRRSRRIWARPWGLNLGWNDERRSSYGGVLAYFRYRS